MHCFRFVMQSLCLPLTFEVRKFADESTRKVFAIFEFCVNILSKAVEFFAQRNCLESPPKQKQPDVSGV